MQIRSTPIKFGLRALVLLGLFAALAIILPTKPALAATITVCASGCDYTTIQDAVNAAANGDTISISPGTYAESVTVNKVVTLDGAGSGSNPVTDTIISGSGSGTGLLLSAGTNASNRVIIKDVRVTNFQTGVVANSYNTLDNVASVSNITYGINLSPLQDLDITNSKFNSNNVGLKIASTASVDDVTISGSEFNSNTAQGWYSDNSSGSPSNITNLNVSYTTFNDNVNKGFYTEKLSDAVFDHITVNNSGTGGAVNHRAGMDFNLKYGSYSDIQITNSTITNNGTGDNNGGGILIKARSTGSYAGNPATLDDVTLTGLTVTGNGGGTYAAGIRIGESNNSFTGIDTGPTDVVISNSAFSGNSAHAVRNATSATTVLAESNWWGNSSGPYQATTNPSGTGDAVGDNVDYSPWWDANYVGDPHLSAWTWHTNDSIQHAIDLASAGDTVHALVGTYNENVVINKNGITLIGAFALNPNDPVSPATHTIIDGSAPPASGSSPGININNGITNVTIKNLRVQQFGSSSGIYGGLGNNGLTIENVHVYNNNASNASGAGIWVNGPVDGVTINKVDAQYNKSRGIVIWNGFKQHITITNSYAAYNNCCGIELQDGTASGVTITGNTSINNTDSGIAAIGLTSGAGANVISNNTVTNNGRFGIEIKLPNGTGLTSGDGSIVVENNTVSLTALPADLRDYAGIAVFRRGWQSGNADIPTGVIVRNNDVSGYVQSNGGSNSTGFGIVAEGNEMQVLNNTLTGNDVGVQVQAGHLPYVANTNTDGDQSNLSDNYFGRGNSPVACARVDGNTYSSNGTDFRVVGSNAHGSPTVHNETQDTYHCGIQVAIDAATSGDVIQVSAGTYTEGLTIDKSLTLRGDPGNASPGPGANVAVLDGGNMVRSAIKINGGVSNVTIEGFEIKNYLNPGNTGGTGSGIEAWNSNPINNVTVNDNYFHDLGWDAVLVGNEGQALHSGWSVTNNLVNLVAFYAIELTNTENSSVTDNVITGGISPYDGSITVTTLDGILIQAQISAGSGQTIDDVTVDNNTLSGDFDRAGIEVLAWDVDDTRAAVLDQVSASNNSVSDANIGLYLYAYGSNASVTNLVALNNTVTDSTTGVYVRKGGGATTVSVQETNDTISNATTGINVNADLTTSNVTSTATGDALIVRNGGSVTANNTLDLNGNATIESGGTLAAGTTSEIQVAGNWTNNGTFTPGTGKVKFDGAVAQTIGGSVDPAPFNDLDLSNSHANGITSNVNATVAGQLAMNQDSNLNMGANILTMGASSNPATAGTGQGDVVGQVKRTSFTSGTSYNFGSPFLAFNNLTFTTAPTDIGVTLATSAPGTYPTAIQRTYTLNVNGGADVNTNLRLHYRDDVTTLNSNTETALRQFRYNGSTWDYIGDNSRSAADNWVQRDGVNSFSDWTLADRTPNAVLLARFKGKQDGAQVKLAWDTASEANLVGFNVWRARGKGEFVKLNADPIPASNPGDLNGHAYTYADPLSKKGRYQYKLELLTTAGAEFSEQIVVRFKPDTTGCATVADKAKALSPKNKAVVRGKNVQFDWSDVACATRYEFTLRENSADGALIVTETNLSGSAFTAAKLKPGVYFWSVRGCNAAGCGPARSAQFTLERNKK